VPDQRLDGVRCLLTPADVCCSHVVHQAVHNALAVEGSHVVNQALTIVSTTRLETQHNTADKRRQTPAHRR